MPVELLKAMVLAEVAHGFFGRRGGVSSAPYDSLNCGPGSGDDLDAVTENRARIVAACAPGATLLTPYQVHSPDVVTVAEAFDEDKRPEADALVTDRAGLMLGILTADCAPVLLADRAAGVIGAAHAGWKGALGGVIENTVAAMQRLGAERERIAAAIGPCIAQQSYEVDLGFRQRFLDADPANAAFFDNGREGHAHLDLSAYVAHRLDAAGVARIERIDVDTCANERDYFSYRRSCLSGERERYGRQLSVIALANE